MALILDTNALSAILVGETEIRSVVERRGPLLVPVIVLGEYEYGIRGSNRAALVRQALDALVSRVDVLPVDRRTATEYAEIRFALRENGTPIPENDVWIAAVARRHAVPILTRDAHFDAVPGIERVMW
ncbi:MAG: type II toxin-antitoxin system VapC family toxin [Spirochaetia bacterium]